MEPRVRRRASRTRAVALAAVCALAACSRADAGAGRAATDAKLASAAPARKLRVCADPNNLPFSNRRGEGFENELARMIGADLHARVTYTWWAQRRGFFRNTLKAKLCDVVLGMPSSVEMAWTTRPYYRSTYVFVSRRDRRVSVASLDDPALRRMRIGVQVLGDDGANPPPVHALARRGMAANLKGYSVYGDYRQDTPPARIVEGVAKGEVDVALVWGPLAGYYARRSPVPLALAPVTPQVDLPYLPFAYDIAMGTRRGDTRLHDELDAFLRRREPQIRALLKRYGVPRADLPPAASAPAEPVAASASTASTASSPSTPLTDEAVAADAASAVSIDAISADATNAADSTASIDPTDSVVSADATPSMDATDSGDGTGDERGGGTA